MGWSSKHPPPQNLLQIAWPNVANEAPHIVPPQTPEKRQESYEVGPYQL